MKIWILVLVVVGGLGWGPTARAQLVVSDPGSLTQQVLSLVKQLEAMAKQVALGVQQYNMLKSAYDAATGARSLGDVLDNPLLRKYLPAEWVEIYDRVSKLGYNAMTAAQRDIYAANQAFDTCKRIKDEDERLTCEALAIQASVKKGLIVPAIQMTAQRALQIRDLQKKMGETKDLKEAAEIQGRIDAEQAQIANSQAELQMFEMQAEAEKELLQQRAYEQGAKDFAKRGYLVPEPIFY
jgi:type IV secretion system protein VirB5